MRVISMLNNLWTTFTDTVQQPQHIAEAVEKIDLTIERLSSLDVLLFQTDYLE